MSMAQVPSEPEVITDPNAPAAWIAKAVIILLASALLSVLVVRVYQAGRASQWRSMYYTDDATTTYTLKRPYKQDTEFYVRNWHMVRVKSEPDVYKFIYNFTVEQDQAQSRQDIRIDYWVDFTDFEGRSLGVAMGSFDFDGRRHEVTATHTFPVWPETGEFVRTISLRGTWRNAP